MIQTYKDTTLTETQRLDAALEQINAQNGKYDRLYRELSALKTGTLEKIYLVAHRCEWGAMPIDSPEGYVYASVKKALKL